MGNQFFTILIIIVLTFSLTTPILAISRRTGLNRDNSLKPLLSDDLVLHDKIFITSNDGFKEFTGSGSNDDPYIISGLLISAPISDDYAPISIHDTDVNFIIENNIITGNGHNNGYGIGLNRVENGLIRNNEINDTTYGGFRIDNSQNITIEYNSILNHGGHGIELFESSNNRIQHNIINSNDGDGIASYFSDNNVIFDNTISMNSLNGISIEESDSHYLIENSISSNNEVGIILGAAFSNIIEFNLIANNPIGLAIRINGGDLVESANNMIMSNTIINNNEGIFLGNGVENTFFENRIVLNSFTGIEFYGGENNNVTQNIISRNGMGFVSSGLSSNNTLNCNLLEENLRYGVLIGSNTQAELVYQNDFVNNQVTPQAQDNGFSNTFENNYWSNLGNQDLNDDGINDLKYFVEGGANNVDYTSSPIRNTDNEDKNHICYVGPDIVANKITGQLVGEAKLVLPISGTILLIFPFAALLVIASIIFYGRKSKVI